MWQIVWKKKLETLHINAYSEKERDEYIAALTKAGFSGTVYHKKDEPEKKYKIAYVSFRFGGPEYSYKVLCDIRPIKPDSLMTEESKYAVLTSNGVRYADSVRFAEITAAEKAKLKYPYDQMKEFVNIKFWKSNLDYTVDMYQFEKNGMYAAHVESCWDHLQNEYGDIIPEKMVTTPYFNSWQEAIDCALKMMEEEEIYVI